MTKQNKPASPKQTVLIVEDEVSIITAIEIKLENEGYNVLLAKNGSEGLSIALEKKPNLILLDLLMPEMDGMTMLHKLRLDDWGKTALVIIFTNYDTDDNRLAEIDTDLPTYYLMKSDNSLEQVMQKIRELFEDPFATIPE